MSRPGQDQDSDLRRLRAMQRLALALLLGAAMGFLVARRFEGAHPLLGYLRAFCEAAMVGGLADWFAVTALFRRPFGLPIPHTAIIPEKKDRLGEALGSFVERNFLSPEIVAAKLTASDFSEFAARWLTDPARAGAAARQLAALLPRILDAAGEEPARHFLREHLQAGLRRVELAPLAAGVLETLTAEDRHQGLVDDLLERGARLLRAAEPEIRERVRAKTSWLWQRLGVDGRISDRLIGAAEEALREVSGDPRHAWRRRFTAATREYIDALRHSEALRARAEEWKEAVLAQPALGQYLGAVWDALRERVREDAGGPDSQVRAGAEAAMLRIGEALMTDAAVREALNGWVRRVLGELVQTRRNEVAALIADTVRLWDARTVADKIERAIGRDLQYIRINGTLIGGLVGLALHAVAGLLRG